MFDMTKLNYISSMGLQVLFKARKAIEAHKGSVIMANLQPQITKVFEIVKALPPETIFQSIEEADDYFDLMQRREIEKKNDSPEG
jgi:anti-anti-sigma factor